MSSVLSLSLVTAVSLWTVPFGIRVVDKETGRGVPLVELRTVNHLSFYTDSNGLAAIDEPSLQGQEVYFHVKSHGYELAADGFGYRGKRLHVRPDVIETIPIQRINIAQRLYRITGEGIYRDSVRLKQPVPIEQPLLNAQVLGSDSVQAVVHRGKIHWFWGDTNRLAYPLGNFHVPGATSLLPEQGGLSPDRGINLNYYTDAKGFAAETARMPGDGPTWIDGLVSLESSAGDPQLLAHYVKIRPPMTVYRHGLVRFDEEKGRFEQLCELPNDSANYPQGHTFLHTVDGVQYIYFAHPFPLLRVRANIEDFQNLASYEAYTCLLEGTALKDRKFDRDAEGRLRYSWKRNTPIVGPAEQVQLIKDGVIRPDEALLQLVDIESGDQVLAHSGTVQWNAFRNRWVLIALQLYGKPSLLGEVWYAEAASPVGPWIYARRIVTHDQYTFYNPAHHAFLDQDGGRLIYFEGTYAQTFSGNPIATPRYDYNQVMYQLDLSDGRLNLPVAVIGSEAGPPFTVKPNLPVSQAAAFFALERATAESVAIVAVPSPSGTRLKAVDPAMVDGTPLFFALASKPDDASFGPMQQPLFEYRNKETGQCTYSVDGELHKQGWERTTLCTVWVDPRRR